MKKLKTACNNGYNSLRRNFLNGNSYLAMKTWLSRNSPLTFAKASVREDGRFRNETIAKPLGTMQKRQLNKLIP